MHLPKYRPGGKAPNAERCACWNAAARHVRALSQQASSGLIASQDELRQFLEQTNWDGIRLAAWIGRKERGQWASGDPLPLPHIRLRTPHSEVWAVHERLQQAGGVWRRFCDWEYKPWKTKQPTKPDEWLAAACLVAVLISPDELRNKLGRDPALWDYSRPFLGLPFRLDDAEARREAVEMLEALARDDALARGDSELKWWLADWIETHHYMYRLVFNATPCEVREAREADADRWIEAEKEVRRCLAERDRQRREAAVTPPSSPAKPSSSPPDNGHDWRLWTRIEEFSRRILEKFEPKYAPWGTSPNPVRYCAWKAFEGHIWDLYAAFQAKRDDTRREELEQCLDMTSSGLDGVRLDAWVQRQSRGEWDPNDPAPVARLRMRTLRRIAETAERDGDGPDGSRFWDVFELVRSAGRRDDDSDNPLWNERYNGWGRFTDWCKQAKKIEPDMFFVPLAYLATWLCPGLMQRRFERSSKSRHPCTVEQMRAESLKFFSAFAADEAVSGKSNSELAEWILGWAERSGCAVAMQLFFGRTPLELRKECEKEEECFRDCLRSLKRRKTGGTKIEPTEDTYSDEIESTEDTYSDEIEPTADTYSDEIAAFCANLTDYNLLLVEGSAGTRMWKRHGFTPADLE